MTPEEQLLKWIEGESVHDQERQQCCPDFSCCKPKLLCPVEERRAFYKAFKEGDEGTMHNMSIAWLAAAFPASYKLDTEGMAEQ